MERYDKYKDSGFDWIGEIPEHWKMKKLKYKINFITGFTPPSGRSEYYQNGQHTWVTITDIKNKYVENSARKITDKAIEDLKPTILPIGSLLYSFKLSVGKVAFNTQELYTNEAIFAIFPNENINLNFYYYSLPQQVIKNANENIYGAKILNQDLIKNADLIIPPFKEQTAIANYLDQKTAEIDELISKKEQLLKLYEEEKTAIINQAVTKGINPDVKLKDSGIDWLGEIPEHWKVKKLKYLANANPSNIDKKSKDGEDEVLLCNYVDVYKNDFINSELDFMKATASESQIEKFNLEKGDVIATKDSETPDDIGNPALVIEDLENVVCGYHLTHIKPININGDFLFRFIQTQFVKSFFEVSANGVTRYGLGVDKFNSALILCPPEMEQITIIQHIETEINRINAKAEKTKKLIDLLGEYKQSLISEVVTGKIKVIKEKAI